MTDPFAGTPAEGADPAFLNQSIEDATKPNELVEFEGVVHVQNPTLEGVIQEDGRYWPTGTYIATPIKRHLDIIKLVFDLTGGEGFIAGGFARYCVSDKEDPIVPNDIDVFCGNEDAFNRIVARLKAHKDVKRKTKTEIETKFEYRMSTGFHKNFYSIQVIRPTQIMNMVSEGDYERILDNFDFTIAKVALINNQEDIIALAYEKFHEHDVGNKLVLTNIHCPISSMKRVIKYCNKGYHIESSELLKLFKDYENRTPEWKDLVTKGLSHTDMNKEERKTFLRTMYFD